MGAAGGGAGACLALTNLLCSSITSALISSGKAARKLGSTPSGMSRSPRIAEKSGCLLGPLLAAAAASDAGGGRAASPATPALAGSDSVVAATVGGVGAADRVCGAPTSTSCSPRAMAAVSSCCSVGEGERGPRASGKGAGASKGDTGTCKQMSIFLKSHRVL